MEARCGFSLALTLIEVKVRNMVHRRGRLKSDGLIGIYWFGMLRALGSQF